NFQPQANGLKVTFENKSTGAHEGWWDFGDGSALEPFVPDKPQVTHEYARPGTYTVKLAIKNLINEENQRSVTVALDGGGPAIGLGIDTFEVVPVRGDYAPATFKVQAKVKDARLAVWALSDRPIEFLAEGVTGTQERFFTFKEPGTHVVKLAVSNGKQAVERA